MGVSKLNKITNSQIASKGVQALADRPNSTSQYGQGGLTAVQLKLWFDKLATFLAEKINEIQDTLSSVNAAKYIRIYLDSFGNITTLDELINAFRSGVFAANVLKVFPNASSQTAVTLQVFINNMAQEISNLKEKDNSLDTIKLDKITSASSYVRVYTVGTDGSQTCHFLSSAALANAIAQYDSNGRLKTTNPVANDDAVNKEYSDARDLLLGSAIVLSLDPTTYVLTVSLKNTSGSVLSSQNIDLPLESLFIGGSYADGILTLRLRNQDGSIDDNVINIDISDIIDGLVSETVFNREVARIDARIDAAEIEHNRLVAEIELSKIYAHAAFHAEESETARNYTKGGKIDRAFKSLQVGAGTSLDVTLDSDFKLTVALKNSKGTVLSSGMVDLPIESLMTNASYSNKILTLTLQNGKTIKVNISDIITGLVPEDRKINGKALNADITLTASDVGAYPTSETFTRTEVSNLINAAKNQMETKIEEKQEVAFGYYAAEADKASGYTKGGAIDKEFKEIKKRIKNLSVSEENN